MSDDRLTPQDMAILKGETSAPDPAIDQDAGALNPAPEAEIGGEEAALRQQPFVPLAEVQRARRQRNEARADADRLRGQLEAYEKLAAGAAEPARPADPEQDPIGAIRAVRAELDSMTAERQNAENRAYFLAAWREAAQQFERARPDFAAAYNHLLESRAVELQAAGLSPHETMAALQEDEVAIVARAFQEGRNPAETIYALARMRGFAPTEDAHQRIANLARGQAATSLAGAPGAGQAALSLKSLIDMSEEDFARLDPSQRRRAMGG